LVYPDSSGCGTIRYRDTNQPLGKYCQPE
jgi:hypothetical protein